MIQPPTLIEEKDVAKEYFFWKINGSIDLAIIPKNTIKGIPYDLPIRLQNGFAKGKKGFGYLHILHNHGVEFTRLTPPQDVFEFLVRKLGQGGSFHYQTPKRTGMFLAMLPTGVIVIDYIPKGKDSFFTIITAYTTNRRIDGETVGQYVSTFQVKPNL